jgi:hypothetical protein
MEPKVKWGVFQEYFVGDALSKVMDQAQFIKTLHANTDLWVLNPMLAMD